MFPDVTGATIDPNIKINLITALLLLLTAFYPDKSYNTLK